MEVMARDDNIGHVGHCGCTAESGRKEKVGSGLLVGRLYDPTSYGTLAFHLQGYRPRTDAPSLLDVSVGYGHHSMDTFVRI